MTGQIGAAAGSILGLAGAARILVTARPESLALPWPMPGGGLHIQIDALSAFFLLPVFGLALAAAVYGRAYLAGCNDESGVAGCWFNLNLLTIGMALVVTAHDGLLFLLAWEIMALSPFFLVIFDDREAAVRHAAWTYLAATHLGTAFLLVLFVLLGDLADARTVSELLRTGEEVPAALLDGARAASVPPDPAAILCSCNAVTRGAVEQAIRRGGLATLAQVGNATRAGTGCGSCARDLEELLARSSAGNVDDTEPESAVGRISP